MGSQVSQEIRPPQALNFFETMVVGDGRLLVGRFSGGSEDILTYQNSSGVSVTNTFTNMVYSVYPEKNPNGTMTPACDIHRWTNFFPIGYAPYETVNEMPSRYRFAKYPFRNATGKLMNPNSNFGSYPWIDSQATNLFYTAIGGPGLYERKYDPILGKNIADEQASTTRFKVSCPDGILCLPGEEDVGPFRGVSVVGFWSKGKTILLDGMLNNTDFGLQANDEQRRMAKLYRDSLTPIGSGREAGWNPSMNATAPEGWVFNTTFIDSLQNRFHHIPEMTPVTAREVVWTVSNGRGTDEVVFDDYLYHGMFIYSEMTGLINQGRHWDGYWNSDKSVNSSGKGRVYLQNAATPFSSQLKVPEFGVVNGTNKRIEPVAQGGIHGKGLWLEDQSSVNYQAPSNTNSIYALPWYVGLFLDRRQDSTNFVRILSFENNVINSHLNIKYPDKNTAILEIKSGNKKEEFTLPLGMKHKSWTHLGLLMKNGNITILQNGIPFAKTNQFPNAFIPRSGEIRIGKPNTGTMQGFRGWIDDFKVMTQNDFNPEELCNHARGTLAAVNMVTPQYRISQANKFLSESTTEILNKIPSHLRGNLNYSSKFFCFQNYSTRFSSNLRNVKNQGLSIRDFLLFPEKFVRGSGGNVSGLAFGVPRPDSSSNKFCLTCHVGSNNAPLLGVQALTPLSIPLQSDNRRQPNQPPYFMYGHIPVNMRGYYNSSAWTPDSGVYIDKFFSPSP